MDRRGFTLVEVMVVVVIIAMLATMSVFTYMKVKEDADQKTSMTMLQTTAKQFDLYKLKHGRYPATIDALIPDYVEKVPLDAWGNSIEYASDPDAPKGFRLTSRGPDAVAGTADDLKHPD